MVNDGQLRQGKKCSYLVTSGKNHVLKAGNKHVLKALNLNTGVRIPINSKFDSGTTIVGYLYLNEAGLPQVKETSKPMFYSLVVNNIVVASSVDRKDIDLPEQASPDSKLVLADRMFSIGKPMVECDYVTIS